MNDVCGWGRRWGSVVPVDRVLLPKKEEAGDAATKAFVGLIESVTSVL